MFLQLQETGMNTQQGTTNLQLHLALMKTFSKLKTLALKSHSVNVALVALEAKQSTSGVFDKLLPKIDDMVAVLRSEEQADVKKRSYCLSVLDSEFSRMRDLTVEIHRTNISKQKVVVHGNELDQYVIDITAHLKRIADQIRHEKEEREKEKVLFEEDTADKKRAISMMENAIDQMEKVYKNNLNEQSLLQTQAPGARPARRLQGEGKSHSGAQEETNIIVDMLTMLQTDLTNEMKEDVNEEEENQKIFKKKMEVLKEKVRESEGLRTDALENKASGDAKIADLEGVIALKDESKNKHGEKADRIKEECSDVRKMDDFNAKIANRKVEMQGLQDAKDVLTGGALS